MTIEIDTDKIREAIEKHVRETGSRPTMVTVPLPSPGYFEGVQIFFHGKSSRDFYMTVGHKEETKTVPVMKVHR